MKSNKNYSANTLVLNGVVLKKLAKTLRKTHPKFNEIYEFYIEEGLPSKEDSEDIRSKKANDLPNDSEVELMVQSANCIRDKAILLCLAHVGLRVSEASKQTEFSDFLLYKYLFRPFKSTDFLNI